MNHEQHGASPTCAWKHQGMNAKAKAEESELRRIQD